VLIASAVFRDRIARLVALVHLARRLAAVATDYVVNTAVVGVCMAMSTQPLRQVVTTSWSANRTSSFLFLPQLRRPASVMALLYVRHSAWAVLLFFGPLLLARQMFFRTRELQHTTEELRARQAELEQALHELATLETERRRLLERTVEATEEERRRIAAELHDGPIQHLAAIVFRLEGVRGALEQGTIPEHAVPALEATQEELREEVVELRRMITQLVPGLDQLGLDDALHTMDGAADSSGRVDAIDLHPAGARPETVLYRACGGADQHRETRRPHVWVPAGRRRGDAGSRRRRWVRPEEARRRCRTGTSG
jgi:signal transduction histidine kinase